MVYKSQVLKIWTNFVSSPWFTLCILKLVVSHSKLAHDANFCRKRSATRKRTELTTLTNHCTLLVQELILLPPGSIVSPLTAIAEGASCTFWRMDVWLDGLSKCFPNFLNFHYVTIVLWTYNKYIFKVSTTFLFFKIRAWGSRWWFTIFENSYLAVSPPPVGFWPQQNFDNRAPARAWPRLVFLSATPAGV